MSFYTTHTSFVLKSQRGVITCFGWLINRNSLVPVDLSKEHVLWANADNTRSLTQDSLLKRILLVNLFPLGLVCTAHIFIMHSKTRQHSSRMRTTRFGSGVVCPLGGWGGGLPYTHPSPRTHYTPQNGPWDGPPTWKEDGARYWN